MAEVVSTTNHIINVNGHNVNMTFRLYSDGGGVWSNPQNKSQWFAQVGPNNDYDLEGGLNVRRNNLRDYVNKNNPGANLTDADIDKFNYSVATTNQGQGGEYTIIRAQQIRAHASPEGTVLGSQNEYSFSPEQINNLGLAGVPGMIGTGALAGQTSTAEIQTNTTNNQTSTIWIATPQEESPAENNSGSGAVDIGRIDPFAPANVNDPLPNNQNQDPQNQNQQTQNQQHQTPTPTSVAAIPINSTGEGRSVAGDTTAVYRYPLKEPPKLGYDYIKIRAMEYKPPGLNVITEGAYGDSERRSGDKFETVILPMQPSISESNATDWNDDQMNAIQGALGGAAAGGIEALGKLLGGDAAGAGGEVKKTFGQLGGQIQYAMSANSGLRQFIIAYFAGQAVGGANIMGRKYGQVINPNLELLFNGPRLRTFNFNFTLTPREAAEAEVIKKIIRCFKRNMAPQRTTANLFLKSPRVFDIQYIYKDGGQHPFLDTFKVCALTSFNVDYTPGGSYATYRDGGSMTQYRMTMSFNELNPIYADEYNAGTPAGDGTGFHIANRT